ncbi:protein phosphatase 1 regulatory subunit 12C-like [Uloborus diversus]|uniref:protein phosphatase 1 regulatory subunit 12C-like n=1 Tax=Uloborus diversus TaxID=327109 RepID=UPI0024092602|nr:protein phosphatase 1 regulatory subunit 12C-like [Uloborus diversus]
MDILFLPRRRLQVTRTIPKTGPDGQTAMHRAAATGDVHTLRELLGRGYDTRIENRWGKTPLQVAFSWKKEAAAEVLVEADTQVDLQDEDGMFPLHSAARNGFVRVMEKLIAAGAGTRVKDRKEKTPLHWALSSEKEIAAELLVNADSEVCSLDSDGCAPLHLAAMHGYVGVARKLLSAGANIDRHSMSI